MEPFNQFKLFLTLLLSQFAGGRARFSELDGSGGPGSPPRRFKGLYERMSVSS